MIPAQGIGDGLMMMVAAHRLHMQGYAVTTFHSFLSELAPWFPEHHFCPLSAENQYESVISPFDLILVQNDGTQRTHLLKNLFPDKVACFYPSYEATKYPPLAPLDRVFDAAKPMVDNIAHAIASLFALKEVSKNNGILPPPELKYRSHKNRVLIHPSGSTSAKTWAEKRFLALAHRLKALEYDVQWILPPAERPHWLSSGFPVPLFPTLSELAAYIYESGYLIGNDSGPGHLASNLQIPTLIIADRADRMRLWRPGWLLGEIATPPAWIPNLKGMRLRETQWEHFIFPSQVLRRFQKLALRDREGTSNFYSVNQIGEKYDP